MLIHIFTYGCTLNQSDSEVMAGLLAMHGHKLVEYDDAELVIFNTCTVKDSPEKSFYSLLEKTLKVGKKVVVAGCVSQADPLNPKLKDISLVGVRHLDMICEAVESAGKGVPVKLLAFKKNKRLNLPKIRKNPVVEILPISAGCLGDCTFCKTRFARGTLYSYPIQEIKKQMEQAVLDGVKEIWLTSQDAGAYGKDIGSSLIELLDELVKVPGSYRIRLGMINPNHAKDMVLGLARFFCNEHAFKFIHLPVQSGSDKVLKAMNRKYTRKEFVDLVAKLRKEVPRISVATDIIVGFPGESEDEHLETVSLIKELKFPVINLTKFYSRPGTAAAKMKLHPTKLVKRRNMDLLALQEKLSVNCEWLSWAGKVLIDEIGKGESFVGRNEYYKPVVVKRKNVRLGDFVNVKIVATSQHYLIGEPY